MSEHICPVVKLGPAKQIAGADKIEYFEVLGNGPVVCVKGDFKEGDLATFIPPETIVDTSLVAFSFLKKNARKSDGWAKVRPVRLRGQLSVGLLLPPIGDEGANGAAHYRVKKIEDFEAIKVEGPKPKSVPFLRRWWLKLTGRWQEENKKLWPGIPTYDINQLYKMPKDLFDPEELMVVTEKLHGTNARYVIGKDGKLWCGSRTMWRLHDGRNVYSRAANEAGVEQKIRRLAEPIVLWGEIVGPQIQKGFDYGLEDGQLKFWCFDMYHAIDRRFLDPDETKNICHWLKISYVPIVTIDHWKHIEKELLGFAQSATVALPPGVVPDHPREGVVVRPWKNVKEAHALNGGRCLLAGKVINPEYLEFREKPGMDAQIIL